MLVWEPVKDRHTFGVNGNHQFCIRLNKENKVTGLYYLTDGTKKWVPSDKDEENLESMKLVAEFILEQKLAKKYY
jgi:hypothetical protein